jgi:hypothetical protein
VRERHGAWLRGLPCWLLAQIIALTAAFWSPLVRRALFRGKVGRFHLRVLAATWLIVLF